jgi:hypothetical protein
LQTTIAHYLVVVAILVCISYLSVYMRRRVARKRAAELAKRRAMPGKFRPLPPMQSAVGVPVENLPNPYPPYTGMLRINDSLRDNSAGYQWMDDQEKLTRETEGCHFCDQAYHVSIGNRPTPWMIYCLARETNFSNFVYQIEATLLQGTEIGVIFRQMAQSGYYYFYIRRDGTYGLQRTLHLQRILLLDGMSSAINIELNQPNVLAVVANGPTIDLYVNQQHLTRVTDATHTAGRISTATATDANSPSEASFRNLMLWTLDEATSDARGNGEEYIQQ